LHQERSAIAEPATLVKRWVPWLGNQPMREIDLEMLHMVTLMRGLFLFAVLVRNEGKERIGMNESEKQDEKAIYMIFSYGRTRISSRTPCYGPKTKRQPETHLKAITTTVLTHTAGAGVTGAIFMMIRRTLTASRLQWRCSECRKHGKLHTRAIKK
jgi:hypothetical protein